MSNLKDFSVQNFDSIEQFNNFHKNNYTNYLLVKIENEEQHKKLQNFLEEEVCKEKLKMEKETKKREKWEKFINCEIGLLVEEEDFPGDELLESLLEDEDESICYYDLMINHPDKLKNLPENHIIKRVNCFLICEEITLSIEYYFEMCGYKCCEVDQDSFQIEDFELEELDEFPEPWESLNEYREFEYVNGENLGNFDSSEWMIKYTDYFTPPEKDICYDDFMDGGGVHGRSTHEHELYFYFLCRYDKFEK